MNPLSSNRRCRLAPGLALGLAVAMILTGCGDTTSPGVQPEIANVTDNFQFQTSSLHAASGTWTYTWQNSGTAATVNQACSITGGTASLVIRNPQGKPVYDRDLADNGTFVTLGGTPGGWTIEVAFDRISAPAMNFRVQTQP